MPYPNESSACELIPLTWLLRFDVDKDNSKSSACELIPLISLLRFDVDNCSKESSAGELIPLISLLRFDVDKGGSIDSEELGNLVRVLGYIIYTVLVCTVQYI